VAQPKLARLANAYRMWENSTVLKAHKRNFSAEKQVCCSLTCVTLYEVVWGCGCVAGNNFSMLPYRMIWLA
jgi:hypothetical protein